MKCCDNCEHYNWYYDYCDVWKCEVDPRYDCSKHSPTKEAEDGSKTD